MNDNFFDKLENNELDRNMKINKEVLKDAEDRINSHETFELRMLDQNPISPRKIIAPTLTVLGGNSQGNRRTFRVLATVGMIILFIALIGAINMK